MYEWRKAYRDKISIHTPTKGATDYRKQKDHVKVIFQSTLPRRERLDRGHIHSHFIVFQSTLPRRERLRSREEEVPLR